VGAVSLLSGRVLDGATVLGAVGAGTVGGVLFGFSTFVMAALDRLSGDRAIEAMQSINRQAPTPAFMGAMFGTAAVAGVLGVDGLRRLDEPHGQLLAAGAASYLAAILVTITYHVPRNDRLAGVATPRADAAQVWTLYSRRWTAANHLRVALAAAAAVLFTVAAATGEQ